MPTVLAAADIGSNTAHLLVANMGLAGIQRLRNDSEWLSLGQVVSHEGVIPKPLVSRLCKTLLLFRSRAATLQADGIYVFATEAVRKARNHEDVLRTVKKETGLVVDIVTPRREAELGLKGALLDSPVEGRFAFAESGGGSVQVAVCDGPEILEETSMPIGTGVLIDKSELAQPASDSQVAKLTALVQSATRSLPSHNDVSRIVACGGVARGLWRALHPDGEPDIALEELRYLAWSSQQLDLKTVAKRYSVKPKRAATLLPGSLVFLALMDKYKTTKMTVSQFGVREGAVLEMSQGKIVPCRL